MLLIGGKNLVPLVSAAVIQSLGWRWVFIIVGIIVAVMFVLTFLFVPETCWDRTPLTADRLRKSRSNRHMRHETQESESSSEDKESQDTAGVMTPIPAVRVRFAPDIERPAMATILTSDPEKVRRSKSESVLPRASSALEGISLPSLDTTPSAPIGRSGSHASLPRVRSNHSLRRLEKQEYAFQVPPQDIEPVPSAASQHTVVSEQGEAPAEGAVEYRFRKKTYREMLAVYQGRISKEKWWKSALRPFILYAYPAIAFVHPLLEETNVYL